MTGTQFTPENITAWRELAENERGLPWTKRAIGNSLYMIIAVSAFEDTLIIAEGVSKSDAAFIVAAVNNFSSALDEIERQAKEIDALTVELTERNAFIRDLANVDYVPDLAYVTRVNQENANLTAENAALKARAEAAERELTELKKYVHLPLEQANHLISIGCEIAAINRSMIVPKEADNAE